MATATKNETVTFLAPCANLRLVKEPKFPTLNHLGLPVGMNPGVSVDFSEGQYSTSDPEIIEWLRNHRQFNVPGYQGFWEDGNAPDEPKPTIPQQQAALEAALDAKDADAVRAVIEEEKATHNREVIFASARIALKALAPSDGTKKEKAPSPSQKPKTD